MELNKDKKMYFQICSSIIHRLDDDQYSFVIHTSGLVALGAKEEDVYIKAPVWFKSEDEAKQAGSALLQEFRELSAKDPEFKKYTAHTLN